MLPTSHAAPINPQPADGSQGNLTVAFDAFIASAGRMEASYGQLQAEVSQLRRELEERNAELASRLAENRRMRASLQRILDALPCGVMVVDNDEDAIVLMNPEAYPLAGIQENASLCLKDFPQRIRTLLRSAMGRDDEHEVAIVTDRATRWLSIRKSTLHVEAGEEECAGLKDQSILILRDITARKEAEQQREASRNMMALGEMAAVLAHEIRNPLSSMELWTGLLAKQPAATEETRHWIEHLQAGVRSLSATVNNVLQLNSRGCPEHIRLKVLAVLQAGVDFVRPLAEQAGIKLTLHTELDGAEIAGDPGCLQQVVLNLAINAFRHTPMGGALTISARRAGDVVKIDFADTGKGVAPANLPSIFVAGFSGDGLGPGLGLTICQQIVQQHRGSISAVSQVGRGTVLSLEFPAL
jgi:two-component system sensor histidine kinase FlrB